MGGSQTECDDGWTWVVWQHPRQLVRVECTSGDNSRAEGAETAREVTVDVRGDRLSWRLDTEGPRGCASFRSLRP